MTEKTAIVADPISSDGSEESWILLDEMDAAMNEDVHSPHHPTDGDEVDQSASTDTITESNPIEEDVAVANDVKSAEKADTANEESVYSDLIPTVIETAEDATNSEAISACPSEDEEVDETAHLRR